jgi:hypothetical protein
MSRWDPIVAERWAEVASAGEGCCEPSHWVAGWRLLRLGVKPYEGLGQLRIVGFFAVEVGARALFVGNAQGTLEGRWMAEQRDEQIRYG